MKPSKVVEALIAMVTMKRPVFLWGAPGIGKSEIVSLVAKLMKIELTDVRAVLLDPVDLRGLPKINGDGLAHWCAPAFLPRKGKGILFLDEMNAAPQLVQAACYQLILDRKLGEYELPEGWTVIAAGNNETDRAVTNRMASPLKNRFIHLDVEIDLNDWCAWALDHDIVTELIAFLRFRPNLLHDFKPERGEKAFPTPRSWSFVSDILKADADEQIERELIRGTVGEGAASEVIAFLKIWRRLPNPDAVLLDPKNAEVPTDPATLYAICGALARKASDSNMDRLVEYATRLPAEFSVLLIRDAIKNEPAVTNTKGFIKWAAAHSEVLV